METAARERAAVIPVRPLPLWAQIFTGSTSACLSVLFTNIPEVVKTRLQLDGEGAKRGAARQYAGVVDAFVRIGRQEGLRGLQAGLSAALLHQTMMNGARLGCYEPIQRALVDAGATPGATVTRVAAGALAGGLGAVLGSPAYLVKSRLQSQSPFFVAKERHTYSGTLDGLRQIASTEGLRGLFRGVDGALPRVMTGSAVQLTSYDLFKGWVADLGLASPGGIAQHTLAGLASSLVTVTVINPLDVISTRLYQSAGRATAYTGPIDCLRQTVRNEGWGALQKGWLPQYLRLGAEGRGGGRALRDPTRPLSRRSSQARTRSSCSSSSSRSGRRCSGRWQRLPGRRHSAAEARAWQGLANSVCRTLPWFEVQG